MASRCGSRGSDTTFRTGIADTRRGRRRSGAAQLGRYASVDYPLGTKVTGMTGALVPTLSPYLFDQTVLVFSLEAEGSFVSSHTQVETYGPGRLLAPRDPMAVPPSPSDASRPDLSSFPPVGGV